MSFMELDHRDFLALEALDQQVREALKEYRHDRKNHLKQKQYQNAWERCEQFKEEHNLGFLKQTLQGCVLAL